MNEKITLPVLTTLLSRATGDSKKQSEDFLREFFSLISATLQNGESVKIKNIGVFKLIEVEARKSVNVTNGAANEIPAHRKVVFIPSKELAADVNEPFEMFETVELAAPIEDVEDGAEIVIPESGLEDFPEETMVEMVEEERIADAVIVTDSPAESDSTDIEPDKHENVEAAISDEPDTVQITPEEPQELCAMEQSAVSDENEETAYPQGAEVSYHRSGNVRFWWGALCGFVAGCLVGIVAMYMMFPDHLAKEDSSEAEVAVAEVAVPADPSAAVGSIAAAEDTASAVVEEPAEEEVQDEVAPTRPSDEKVYDTITKTRYLTTMAQDHYGNFNFWPYIYKENQAILGHPDRIRPGTKVVVPKLSKYGVSVDNPKDIVAAKRLGVEIYSRYPSHR